MISKSKYIPFLLFLVLHACQNPFSKQIQIINDLEVSTVNNVSKLETINLTIVEQNLKIAKTNLLQLEDKNLDTLSFELIYFEYRKYLNCVNILQDSFEKVKQFKKQNTFNQEQLSNLKLDYKNSNIIRTDLDHYLQKERAFIKKTNKEIDKFVQEIHRNKLLFDSVNQIIETTIHE